MISKMIFLGSSVTYGAASGGYSMAEYIQETMHVNMVKWAVSGTTLVDNGPDSYVQRLLANVDSEEACDYFVCQLSTNDASQNKPLGEISLSKKKEDFDTTTILGAIEFIIATAKNKWNCPVAFYTGTKYDSDLYQQMVDKLYEIKEKWNIGIVDLWNDSEMNEVSPEAYQNYMADPIHPTKLGYQEWWGPKFREFLEK